MTASFPQRKRDDVAHPTAILFGIPAIMIVIVIMLTVLFIGLPSRKDDDGEPLRQNTADAIVPDAPLAISEPERIDPTWFDRLAIGSGITVQVNALAFSLGSIIESAVVNGTNESVMMLTGCMIPMVEKEESGTFVPFRMRRNPCTEPPTCTEIGSVSVVRSIEWDQTIIRTINGTDTPVRESGTYRIPLTYGTGCDGDTLVNPTTITSEEFLLE